jgi:hypothetical protein
MFLTSLWLLQQDATSCFGAFTYIGAGIGGTVVGGFTGGLGYGISSFFPGNVGTGNATDFYLKSNSKFVAGMICGTISACFPAGVLSGSVSQGDHESLFLLPLSGMAIGGIGGIIWYLLKCRQSKFTC